MVMLVGMSPGGQAVRVVCACVRMPLNASVNNPPEGHLNTRVCYFFLQEVQRSAVPRRAQWPTDFTTDPSSILLSATLGLLCGQLLVPRGWQQLRHSCVLTCKAPRQTRALSPGLSLCLWVVVEVVVVNIFPEAPAAGKVWSGTSGLRAGREGCLQQGGRRE